METAKEEILVVDDAPQKGIVKPCFAQGMLMRRSSGRCFDSQRCDSEVYKWQRRKI